MAKKEVVVDPDAARTFSEPEPLPEDKTLDVIHDESKDEEKLKSLLSRRKKAVSPSKKQR